MNIKTRIATQKLGRAKQTPAASQPTPPPEDPKGPQDPKDGADLTQAERITGFVAKTKVQGASTLRNAMGMMAGQLTGMTIGSMIFAPLAFKFGNLYIATGGAAITGGALALLGSKLSSKPVEGEERAAGLKTAMVHATTALKSMPNFIYPTVVGATAHEKEVIYGALDKLPLTGVTSAPTIDVVSGMQKAGAAGLATPLFSHSRIFLDRDEMAWSDDFAQEVTIHEIGHTYDFTKGVGPILNRSHRGGGFGKAPFVSDYAGTNRMEDYAEGYSHYYLEPDHLLEKAPVKHATIEASQQPGVVDAALDRPKVRDAGRRIGTAFEAAPRLRNLLALGSSLVAPFQLYRGAANYERAAASGDKKAMIEAKMQLASGSALMLGATTPLSLGIAADKIALQSQVDGGKMTLDQAEAHADKVLTVATGPFGFAASSMQSELASAGLLLKGDGGKPMFFGPAVSQRAKNAMGAGFALGAAAGGLVGPLLGGSGSAVATVASAAAGTVLAGVAGGALGLGAHHLTKGKRTVLGMDAPSALTKDDKKLLAKLAGSTIVGGAAGAVLGSMAGSQVGQMVGQALGGSVGGVTGAALGKYVGLLGGSYALAKGGSKLGAKWAGLNKAG